MPRFYRTLTLVNAGLTLIGYTGLGIIVWLQSQQIRELQNREFESFEINLIDPSTDAECELADRLFGDGYSASRNTPNARRDIDAFGEWIESPMQQF